MTLEVSKMGCGGCSQARFAVKVAVGCYDQVKVLTCPHGLVGRQEVGLEVQKARNIVD